MLNVVSAIRNVPAAGWGARPWRLAGDRGYGTKEIIAEVVGRRILSVLGARGSGYSRGLGRVRCVRGGAHCDLLLSTHEAML